ncbi:hypothetical protein FGG08_005305 [Glutinoglossum americanum]|uniref:tyrosine--tRNA ligase n=1 Tax=Glutinoglossum americanum TaxID=1670608 RepID=A0A9P8KYN3_9PEZI|nr:hypothetical protein FGG08_005305 [Glutinoglossum americanum]
MASILSIEERFNLITRRLPAEDVHGAELIKAALETKGKTLKCLWAHIGYFVPLLKFVDFLEAGVEVVVLLLDVYSFLDNVKYPMEQVLQRMHYYKFTIMAALEAIGIPSSRVRFVQESTYQTNLEFISDQWRLCTLVPQQAVRDAWDRSYNPNILSPMLCPGLQTLAEEHLGVDIQFGGEDQARIFAFAERYLPQLGYERRAHIMNPMLPNCLGEKMSSSSPPNTKIMILDSPDAVTKKISEADDRGNNVAENGVLASLRDILIPISELRLERLQGRDPAEALPDQQPFCSRDAPEGTVFTVETGGGNGRGYKHYKSYKEIEQDLAENELSHFALNMAIADAFNQLLDPIHKAYGESKEWQEVDMLGYPDISA